MLRKNVVNSGQADRSVQVNIYFKGAVNRTKIICAVSAKVYAIHQVRYGQMRQGIINTFDEN